MPCIITFLGSDSRVAGASDLIEGSRQGPLLKESSVTEEPSSPADSRASADPLDAATLKPQEAGFSGVRRREGPFAVDGLVLGVIGQLLSLVFLQSFTTLGQAGRLIGLAIARGYVVPAHALWGQTLGKLLLGIRVQRIDGEPLTMNASLCAILRSRRLGF